MIGIPFAEFAAIEIKLGHWRKLQREAARRHSWPDYQPLPIGKSICCLHKKSVIVHLRFNLLRSRSGLGLISIWLVDFREEREGATASEKVTWGGRGGYFVSLERGNAVVVSKFWRSLSLSSECNASSPTDWFIDSETGFREARHEQK